MSPAIRPPQLNDYALLLCLTIIWSSAFLAIKIAVPETGPVWLAASRVTIAFMITLPWFLWRGAVFPTNRKDWTFIIVLSFINITIPFLLISWAQQFIDTGVSAMLLGTTPFLALTFNHFATTDDKFNSAKLIAVVFGFAGISLVVGEGVLDQLDDSWLAQAAIIAAAICYVCSSIMVRKLSTMPPTRMTTLVMGFATIQLITLGLIDGLPDIDSISTNTWMTILYLGIFPTGLAAILRFQLIRKIGASYFSLGLNLIPVFGVSLGAIVLGEKVSWTVALALLLIVSGLFIARLKASASITRKQNG